MLVSDSHKFVFHHVPKTAGSSITAALAPFCNRWKGVLPEESHGWQVQFHQIGMHTHLGRIKEEEEKTQTQIFPEYFSFAYVRNPYEVVVSAWDSEKIKDFDIYVEQQIFTGLQICARRSQYAHLSDEEGNLLVDFIGRYENFSEDFYKIIDAIQVPLMLIPKRNVRKERKTLDYKKYYTPLSREIVEEKYQKDLTYFGYEF